QKKPDIKSDFLRTKKVFADFFKSCNQLYENVITNINKVLSNQLIFVKSKSQLFTSLLNTISRTLFNPQKQ
ncbi:TPA: hypothetical protein ACPT5Y_004220, partial [Escherichia coli]